MGKRKPRTEEIMQVPIKDIEISESNVRMQTGGKDLEQLAYSIEILEGLLQPVVLLGPYDGTPKYKLIIGQRRFRAQKEILAKKDPKWETIPAIIQKPPSDIEAKIRSLAENFQRVDLNYEELREAVTALYRYFENDAQKVHRATGIPLMTVRRIIYVDELASPKMLELLRNEKVSLYDVKRALNAARDDIGRAERLLEAMVGQPRRTKKKLAQYAEDHPERPVDDKMVEEATKPEVNEYLSVAIPEILWDGLGKAAKAMEMEITDVAAAALEEWLREKGFVE